MHICIRYAYLYGCMYPKFPCMHLLTPNHVGVQQDKGFPLLDLPEEMQRLILGHIPLRELARTACLSTALRATYRDRTQDRDAGITAVLESHFTAEFREGLTPAQTALPYDLIVDPPVRGPPFADGCETQHVDYPYVFTHLVSGLDKCNYYYCYC
jgi:hypothetical protein